MSKRSFVTAAPLENRKKVEEDRGGGAWENRVWEGFHSKN